jgi:hypothetical protein
LPSDIAYASLFFLSNESRWITGSELVIDGGLTFSLSKVSRPGFKVYTFTAGTGSIII